MKSTEESMDAGEDQAGSRRRRTGRKRSSDPARLLSAVDEARRSLGTAIDDLRERVEEKPLQTLGLAVGTGYILGGGLFTALTGRLLYGTIRIGLRLAALPLVREELLGLVDTITENGRGDTERRQQ